MPFRQTLNVLAALLFALAFAGSAIAADAAKPAAHKAKSHTRSTHAESATPPADALVWRGDIVSARAFMDDIARLYASEHKGHIVLQPFSTVSGLDAVAHGTADLAGSARGKDDKRPEEAGLNFIPIALDAIVAIANPKNPVGNLTLKQLYNIYLGRITNWKELGGNDAPIDVSSIAAPFDGVELSMRWLVYRNIDQPVAAPRLYLNTQPLETDISLNPNGIGLSTLSSVADNTRLKMLSVEGIPASTDSVANGTYPLYTPLYLADRADNPHAAKVDAFIAFLSTPEAKAVMRRHQLVPYADVNGVVDREKDRLAWIDAHLASETKTAAAAPAPTSTPVSAPNATLESKVRIAPSAESTQAARARAAEAAAAKAKTAKTTDPAADGKN